MSASDLTEYVQQLRLDVDSLADARVGEIIGKVLNLVEAVVAEDRRLREENQGLREIIRQLKGKPPSPARPSPSPSRDVSSEKERQKRTPPSRGVPRADGRGFRDVHVHKEIICPVDPASLPPDAKPAGYEDVVVQDLRIQNYNIRYRLEIWHSPSQGSLRGKLPLGVTGEYGPELKALLVSLKYVAGTSLPRAHEFMEHCGVVISPATVSNIVRDAAALFHEEKEEIFRAGLAATTYQHIDDTSARVGGEFWHTHIVCNPFHSTYFTTPHKDRLTILDLLAGRPADVPIQRLDAAVAGGVSRALEVAASRDSGPAGPRSERGRIGGPARTMVSATAASMPGSRTRGGGAGVLSCAAGPCADFGGRRRKTSQTRVGRVWAVLDS